LPSSATSRSANEGAGLKQRLLLAGGGHAHLGVLHDFARAPLVDTDITLVSPFPRQVYSGMLPGWIAGHYALDACVVQLAQLVARSGASFQLAHLARIDLATRTAYTEAAEPIAFDLLSIDTGPVVDAAAIPGLAEHAIALRPLESLIGQWQRLLVHFADSAEPGTLTVIGGGAGGVELALAFAFRATRGLPLRVQLVAGRAGPLASFAASMRERITRLLHARGVRLIVDDAVEITRHTVLLADGGELTTQATLVAIGAAAAEWPRAGGLATDESGFITVNDRMQSTSHPFVFASGDCATMLDHPRPKSGVYAVRAGPPLARNLRRALAGQALRPHTPQQRALYLLSAGDRYAVASWGDWSLEGAWVWHWKNRIDQQFVAQFAGTG
jgi:pyridine nucleotide-disulfide oxidoreductase family protein